MSIGVDGFRWWATADQQAPKPSDLAKLIILYSGVSGGTSLRPPASMDNEGFLFCDTLQPGGNISRSNGTAWVDITDDRIM